MSRFDPFRDWPKHGDHRPSKREDDARQIMTDAAQILDVVKGEWGSSWSGFDQGVRDRISTWLADHYAEYPAASPTTNLRRRDK